MRHVISQILHVIVTSSSINNQNYLCLRRDLTGFVLKTKKISVWSSLVPLTILKVLTDLLIGIFCLTSVTHVICFLVIRLPRDGKSWCLKIPSLSVYIFNTLCFVQPYFQWCKCSLVKPIEYPQSKKWVGFVSRSRREVLAKKRPEY